jgi:hypothetical protein
MNKRLLTFFLVVLVSFSWPSIISAEPITQQVLAEFEFDPNESIIFLPVNFNGDKLWFILDTGASFTGFDAECKPLLGKLKRTIVVNNGAVKLDFFDAPKAFLGPFDIQICGEVFCRDMKMWSQIADRKVSGILGMDFLKYHVVQIDFDKGTLCFLRPQKNNGLFSFLVNEKHNEQWGELIKMAYGPKSKPYIMIKIDNIGEHYCMIDTGASQNSIEPDIFEKVVSKKSGPISDILVYSASGVKKSHESRIGRFSVGTLDYQSQIFSSGRSCLGIDFLSRHKVTFDFPNKNLYLKKGNAFNKISESNMSGLSLMRISNQIVVYYIDKEGPAQKAGIKTNDVIENINGKNAGTLNLLQVENLLKGGDGKEIRMTILSDRQKKDVTFKLKKKI